MGSWALTLTLIPTRTLILTLTPFPLPKCLPLTAMKKCNQRPCPVDCRLSEWSGWSKCSAECGGGVQQRLRNLKVADKFGGKPCDPTSETRGCKTQACDKE